MVVAVKRLKKAGQGMEEFLAEMETLGNIHHVNLVRLIGFCADRKNNRMLVYEYMACGSLDKWIFFRDKGSSCLTWNMKKKILFDIAKELAYLHHECRHKIAHLDVKPQDILLDEKFNAKLSDFGTSKLINRNQSEVLTHVRGTLGYLAPEWQHEKITVKADTYSFGVVILEVVTGRKVLDYSQQPESHIHLLSLLQTKAAENRLIDIVDHYSKELTLQSERDQVVAVMQLGMWCLNITYTKRPAMSLVVKFLEGIVASSPNCNLLPVAIKSPRLNCLSSDVKPL
uniref:non-specific serine/threonine protein kinase n=1 Tax=Kalanchoe fedtschenkoi TaxID=63787 RepID=A0A7N0V927_KALFE